jgi:hypothetical protein
MALDWVDTLHIVYVSPLSRERHHIAKAKIILRLKQPELFGEAQLDEAMQIILNTCPLLMRETVDMVDISGRNLNRVPEDGESPE